MKIKRFGQWKIKQTMESNTQWKSNKMEIKRPTGNQTQTVSETVCVSEIVSEIQSNGQWKSNQKEIKRPTGNQNQTVSETQKVSEIVSEIQSKDQWKSNKKKNQTPNRKSNPNSLRNTKCFRNDFGNEIKRPMENQYQLGTPLNRLFANKHPSYMKG